MAKYQCWNCPTPCVLDTLRTAPQGNCLYYCKKADWQKVEPDKPDPQAEDSSTTLRADGDEIVKLADKLLYEHSLEGSRKALKPVFRLIAAEIEGCVKDDPKRAERIGQWRDRVNGWCAKSEQKIEALERKVEELENKVSQVLPDLTPTKPQDRAVAYAWDKDHKELHELKPGVSVIQGRAIATAVFCKDKGEGLLRVRWLNTGLYGAFFLSQTTWLFDLDFPPHMGGDK